jgi:hypothetical protein
MGLKNTSEQEESDWEEKHLRRIQGSAVLRLFSLMGSHPRTFVLGVLMVLLGTLATLLMKQLFQENSMHYDSLGDSIFSW